MRLNGYAEASNKLAGSIFASLLWGNMVLFEKPQRWQVVGNSVSVLTGPRFELDDRVTARPTGWSFYAVFYEVFD